MSGAGEGRSGSRYLYEPFDATAARLAANERVDAERWAALERRLLGLEAMLERLERRLWLAVFGVVAFVLTQGVYAVLQMVPK